MSSERNDGREERRTDRLAAGGCAFFGEPMGALEGMWTTTVNKLRMQAHRERAMPAPIPSFISALRCSA